MLSLPDIDDPLSLPDGTILHTDGSISRTTRPMTNTVEIPTHHAAQAIVANTRRVLADLPLDPKSTNPLAVVLSYTLFGLSNTDIAIATGLSEKQITNIRMTDAYAALYDTIKTSIIEAESANVRGYFTAVSRGAAMKVAALAAQEDEPLIALKASQDILDRAGHRPADVVRIEGQIDNILRIEHYTRDKPKTPDNIIDLGVEPHGPSSN